MKPTEKWQDWTSFALGLWLAVSPWAAGYEVNEAATCNAAFVGVALALFAHLEVGLNEAAVEWLNLAMGLWLVAAPFTLGFAAVSAAAANSIAVGCLATLLAASSLELDKSVARWWLQEVLPLIRP